MDVQTQEKQRVVFGTLNFADLQHWLANLRRTNHEDYTYQLVSACNDIANAQINNTLAVQLLDEIRAAIYQFSKELSHRFLHQSIDLPKDGHAATEQYKVLWEHLGKAYISHVKQDATFNEPSDALHKPSKCSITCLHRSVHSQQQILLGNLLLYRNDEPGQWHTLHELFSLGLQHHINEHRINDPLNQDRPICCITDLYAAICVLRIANCNQLNQLEIFTVWHFLQKYSVLIDIDNQGESPYKIDFSNDCPPIIDEQVGEKRATLSLNFQELIDEIKKSTNGEKHEIQLNQRLRQHLLRALSANVKRKMPRHESLGKVEIALGLNNAWLAFSHQRNLNSMIHFLNNRTDSFENDANVFLKAKRETVLKDNWNTHFGESDERGNFSAEKVMREIESAQKSVLNASSDGPNLISADMVEHSATGFSLSLSRPLNQAIRNGDVLALREQLDDRYVVAVVRWIRNEDKCITFGAEILSPNAACFGARAIPAKGNIADAYFLSCLFLPAIPALKQTAKLLLPSIPFIKGNRVQLLRDDIELVVKLTENEQSSFSHSIFTFEDADDPMQRIPIIGNRITANDPAISVLFV